MGRIALLLFIAVASCRLVSLPSSTCADGTDCFLGEVCCSGVCVAEALCASSDAGLDAGVDAGTDADADAGVDAGPDAGADASVDAGIDAGFDGGPLPTIVCNWGTATQIGWTVTALQDGTRPLAQVAAGPHGEAAVVYGQPDGSAWEVYGAYAGGDGGNWGTLQRLGSDPFGATSTPFATPRVVIDWPGTATAVWGLTTGGPYRLAHARHRASDSAWQPALESATGYANPVVSQDGAGWIHAVSNNGANYASHMLDPDASTFSSVGLVGSYAATGSVGDIAIKATGGAVFACRTQVATNKHVEWAAHYSPGTGWTATQVSSDAGDYGDPRVAIDDNGNTLVVWTQPVDAGTFDVYWNWKPSDGGWAIALPIQAAATYSRTDPSVSARGGGWIVATWTESPNELASEIRAVTFRPGIGWSSAAKVSGSGGSRDPRVGVDAVGNARFAWNEWSPGDKIKERRYTPGNDFWGTTTPISVIDAGVVSLDLDVAPSGHAALVWIEEVAPYQFTINAAICR